MRTINSLWLFIILTLVYLLVNYSSTIVLNTQELIYNSLIEQLSRDRAMQLIDKMHKLQWLGYAFIPIMLLIKLFLVSVALSAGEVFYNLKLSFSKAFRVALLSESVFVVMALVKFLWLWLFVSDLSLEYLQFFVPLSLINLFKPGELYPWFVYLIQTFNLFELAYIYLLIRNVNKTTECGMEKASSFILSTYGIGLIMWIILVGFITLNFSA